MPEDTPETPGLSDQKPVRSAEEILGKTFNLDPQAIGKIASFAALLAIIPHLSTHLTESEREFFKQAATQPFPFDQESKK
jgi:hypothetical protein